MSGLPKEWLAILCTLGSAAVVIWQISASFAAFNERLEFLASRVEAVNIDGKDRDREMTVKISRLENRVDETQRFLQVPMKGITK